MRPSRPSRRDVDGGRLKCRSGPGAFGTHIRHSWERAQASSDRSVDPACRRGPSGARETRVNYHRDHDVGMLGPVRAPEGFHLPVSPISLQSALFALGVVVGASGGHGARRGRRSDAGRVVSHRGQPHPVSDQWPTSRATSSRSGHAIRSPLASRTPLPAWTSPSTAATCPPALSASTARSASARLKLASTEPEASVAHGSTPSARQTASPGSNHRTRERSICSPTRAAAASSWRPDARPPSVGRVEPLHRVQLH
jgi:hypothetical protein